MSLKLIRLNKQSERTCVFRSKSSGKQNDHSEKPNSDTSYQKQ